MVFESKFEQLFLKVPFSDFLIASSLCNKNNCSVSVLAKSEKTSGFARNWPLARAKFAAVFQMFNFEICFRLRLGMRSQIELTIKF
jgi:hypothetical protein